MTQEVFIGIVQDIALELTLMSADDKLIMRVGAFPDCCASSGLVAGAIPDTRQCSIQAPKIKRLAADLKPVQRRLAFCEQLFYRYTQHWRQSLVGIQGHDPRLGAPG